MITTLTPDNPETQRKCGRLDVSVYVEVAELDLIIYVGRVSGVRFPTH